ncbi:MULTISPECIES: NAD-dependent epimerase/dehydratase family protein [unclassified Facklamia]|uniref:NAD-dependent epimerase/dehydratase family protein n=1 Tax=Aerococcaceae TaxID=186827 RepID=UPI0013BB63EB|nr:MULTISPECIES: NAD-dependent epimerase/dehydratase family protein [unclassified Facklamia]MBS4462474.1 NAD-dependent epimerase/dehydratase family protein [Aerococcaceae bacterium zg-B36]NEW65062.1 NAD-dependent epimerase/dehydratase family protein [Facklamia sp. 252]NEW68719.1 NAD-dependent epimerase/dehydratase family protein [Facklamia sp. 253]QQD65126.1 NAD-dependent epimerase/dehydratase family protein [Aerococcaceae bacterium zg-252]
MKKILIVGKNSYIGQSFINYTSERGHDFEIDEVDAKNDEWKKLNFGEYHTIFHVAGIAHNSSNPKLKDLYYSVNRDLTIEVAKKAKNDGAKQFVFMSSMIVFGTKNSAITEETVPNPDNFYGDSKLQAEKGIISLQADTFNIAIMRPPMVYGKGSKGNYPKLAKLAQKIPVFPDYDNKRSMIHIDNLMECIAKVIELNLFGYFHPQNKEYINTSNLVKEIAKAHNHNIITTKLFNSVISALKTLKIFNKMFGDLYYEKKLSRYSFSYQIVDFEKSILRTEKEQK